MKTNYYVSDNIVGYGKTALAFAPTFFRITKSIIAGFEENNIGVILALDKPSNSTLLKTKLRLNPKFISGSMKRYIKRIGKDISSKFDPDYVVIFEGQAFLAKHIELLKSFFPKSEFIIYCWDSVERFPHIENNLKLFDRRVTFCKPNLLKFGFDEFVPLFIPTEFSNIQEQKHDAIYDLAFIGTGHPPKVKFLKTLEEYSAENGISFYESCYLPSKGAYFYYKLTSKAFKKKKKRDFVFFGKTDEEIRDVYSKSKAVVDAGNPNEGGISLRIFECLSMNKKVVLSNANIRDYSFYDKSRFLIFPEEKERFRDFINGSFKKLSEKEKGDLSCKIWIKNILGI